MMNWIHSRHWTARLFVPMMVGLFCATMGHLLDAHPAPFIRDMLISAGVFGVYKEVIDRWRAVWVAKYRSQFRDYK